MPDMSGWNMPSNYDEMVTSGKIVKIDFEKQYKSFIESKVTLPNNGGFRDRTPAELAQAQREWDTWFKPQFQKINDYVDWWGASGSQEDYDKQSLASVMQAKDVPSDLLRWRPDITGVSPYSTRYGGPISEDRDPWAKKFKSLSSTPTSPSNISSNPSNISPSTQTVKKDPVKTAPIDTIQFDDDVLPIAIIQDLLFQNIGGQELINTARTDTVNGQKVVYQPIKNLSIVQQQFNPNNIVSLQNTADKYFENFTINFSLRVPEKDPGEEYIYIDSENGDLVIEAINLKPDEQIEVQIKVSGTIYEAEL